MILFKI